MIIEEIIHTEPEDIPKDYYYDTETPDFYVYRHKYTGKEIHIVKNPKTYINIQRYINEVLEKIRAEITELDNEVCKRFLIEDIDKEVHHTYQECLNIIDKYKSESEDK